MIAMGIKHANRIEECLLQRLREDPELEELAEFFAEDERGALLRQEPRARPGRRARRDHPLDRLRQERHAATSPTASARSSPKAASAASTSPITRAKHRMTLVSSFGSRDMDPERSHAAGRRSSCASTSSTPRSDGREPRRRDLDKPRSTRSRSTSATRSPGTASARRAVRPSGYWIDYAVRHPTQPGRYVLAIECDGATYHSSESARDRDRLRQEQLERLGWRFHRIWSSDWFYNKESAVEGDSQPTSAPSAWPTTRPPLWSPMTPPPHLQVDRRAETCRSCRVTARDPATPLDC